MLDRVVRRSSTLISWPSLMIWPLEPGAVGAAEQAHRELGASGAHQAGEADDLAAADVEARALARPAARSSGCCTVQSRTSKKISPMFGVRSGKRLLELAADHAADDAVLVDAVRLDVERLDGPAVAHDRDRVGDLPRSR